MGTKRMTIVLGTVVLLSISIGWAGEGVEAIHAVVGGSESAPNATSASPSLQRVPAIEPWIHPNMPDSIREKLDTAFDIAIERISLTPECAGLFEALGAEPFETLETGLYFPASPARETSSCRRSFAQTNVGAAPTWICRRITSYSDEQAAMVVIHEALHHAGLTEKPHDRKAMTSGQINDMVREACDL